MCTLFYTSKFIFILAYLTCIRADIQPQLSSTIKWDRPKCISSCPKFCWDTFCSSLNFLKAKNRVIKLQPLSELVNIQTHNDWIEICDHRWRKLICLISIAVLVSKIYVPKNNFVPAFGYFHQSFCNCLTFVSGCMRFLKKESFNVWSSLFKQDFECSIIRDMKASRHIHWFNKIVSLEGLQVTTEILVGHPQNGFSPQQKHSVLRTLMGSTNWCSLWFNRKSGTARFEPMSWSVAKNVFFLFFD